MKKGISLLVGPGKLPDDTKKRISFFLDPKRMQRISH
jgi:hypothetical protein